MRSSPDQDLKASVPVDGNPNTVLLYGSPARSHPNRTYDDRVEPERNLDPLDPKLPPKSVRCCRGTDSFVDFRSAHRVMEFRDIVPQAVTMKAGLRNAFGIGQPEWETGRPEKSPPRDLGGECVTVGSGLPVHGGLKIQKLPPPGVQETVRAGIEAVGETAGKTHCDRRRSRLRHDGPNHDARIGGNRAGFGRPGIGRRIQPDGKRTGRTDAERPPDPLNALFPLLRCDVREVLRHRGAGQDPRRIQHESPVPRIAEAMSGFGQLGRPLPLGPVVRPVMTADAAQALPFRVPPQQRQSSIRILLGRHRLHGRRRRIETRCLGESVDQRFYLASRKPGHAQSQPTPEPDIFQKRLFQEFEPQPLAGRSQDRRPVRLPAAEVVHDVTGRAAEPADPAVEVVDGCGAGVGESLLKADEVSNRRPLFSVHSIPGKGGSRIFRQTSPIQREVGCGGGRRMGIGGMLAVLQRVTGETSPGSDQLFSAGRIASRHRLSWRLRSGTGQVDGNL